MKGEREAAVRTRSFGFFVTILAALVLAEQPATLSAADVKNGGPMTVAYKNEMTSLDPAIGYDGAFTFVYSHRVGTEAAAMPDQIPEELKRDRIERLVEVVQRVAARRNADRVGKVEEVLVEGPSRTEPEILRGRTRRNTTVNFRGEAAPGELVSVAISSATSTTLAGDQLALAVA